MQVVRGQEMKLTRLRAITLNTGTALHRQLQLYGDLLERQAFAMAQAFFDVFTGT